MLEYVLIYFVPFLVFIVVVVMHRLVEIPKFKKFCDLLVSRGLNSKVLSRIVTLSAILSVWLALSQHLVTSLKEAEKKEQELSSLVRVFDESSERQRDTLNLIVNGKSRHYMGIKPIEFRDFSVTHIDLLINNSLANACFDLPTLFSLKDELQKLNIAMPSIREMTGMSVENSIKNTWVTLDIDLVARSALSLYSTAKNMDSNCPVEGN
ncbi:hypothetical protein EK599_07870 [Vibrio sp. T187]|uniref:hypothetical protein n=1 Tax=Vibrio TaxID=662 RepID=UPI0010C9709B|nr:MULTISPECIES: hypothetical protein [Vibrio]MBW3695610.1 hypothetical protein [Vibrio sp. T187]